MVEQSGDVIESECRERKALAALYTWDEDHRAGPPRWGGRIPKHPEYFLCQLRTTLHGCDWLLERWTGLLETLQRGDDWTEGEAQDLGLDLLGTPAEFREGRTRVNAATAGRPGPPPRNRQPGDRRTRSTASSRGSMNSTPSTASSRAGGQRDRGVPGVAPGRGRQAGGTSGKWNGIKISLTKPRAIHSGDRRLCAGNSAGPRSAPAV